MQNKTAPRWDLKNIYPDFKSKEYAESKKKIPALTSKFEKHLKAFSDKDLKKWLVKALDILNEFNAEAETLYAYASAVYTTDTENKEALSELNSISALFVPFTPLGVRFSNILASVSKEVKALIKNDKDLKYASFYLEDTLFWQKKQMSEEEESLAADLARSGASAWSKLQSTLTSTASCIWDEKTKEEKREEEYKTLKTDLGKVATKIALVDNGEVQTKEADIAKKVQKLNLKSEKKVIEDKVHAIDKELESEKEAKRKAEAEKVAKDKAKKQETERKAQVTQALTQPSTPVGPSTIHAAIKQVANSYPWGQCTWGVKNLAPWAGDYWGNADMWAASAASQGFKVGTKPVAGAIAVWSGMHVAYVTDVQSDTKIQVLESNFAGNPNIGNYRGWFNPVNAQGSVSYIYPPGS